MDDTDKGSHLESDKLDDIEKAFESDEMDDIEKGSPVECDISEVDNIAYAETVIQKVKYKGIASDLLQVPSCLKIDPEKVAKLKHLLVSTPDKTQTFCGCVGIVDKENKSVNPCWVYVNPELFVALKELACYGRGDDIYRLLYTLSVKMIQSTMKPLESFSILILRISVLDCTTS